MSVCSQCHVRLKTLLQNRPLVSSLRQRVALLCQAVPDGGLRIQPTPDFEYLLDLKNLQPIRDNIRNRKGVGDIDLVHTLSKSYETNPTESARQKLLEAALRIPNRTCPTGIIGSEGEIVKEVGTPSPNGDDFVISCIRRQLLRFQTLTKLVAGSKSYFLSGDLARLERALVRWTLDKLIAKGWVFVSVPDMLPEKIIGACGFVTTGPKNQIFKVRRDEGGLCFAGTSEIPMAALHAGQKMPSEVPIKMCTYSQCYRAEEAKNKIDKGFYRLHQFTKVEMFGICMPDQSESLLNEIVSTQCELFSELELCYKLRRMPSEELGAAAYQKYDVEAWLSHHKKWGEISSASNCTDYQTRRLAITTPGSEFAHTVNGTGCAVPRMLMAIVEQATGDLPHSEKHDPPIPVPKCLVPYMKQKYINRCEKRLRFIKTRQQMF